MVETLRFTKIFSEDIAIGEGMQEVTLADGRVSMLNEAHVGSLLLKRRQTVVPTSGDASVKARVLLAGARVLGVTIRVTKALGKGNSLTTLSIGDDDIEDRWGTGIGITVDTVTGQDDFRSEDIPIYSSVSDVIISADGGTFDGTGEIRVTAHFMRIAD